MGTSEIQDNTNASAENELVVWAEERRNELARQGIQIISNVNETCSCEELSSATEFFLLGLPDHSCECDGC